MSVKALRNLNLHQLRELYDAERQIVHALPVMIDEVSHEQLLAHFRKHLEETQTHLKRLDDIFSRFDEDPQGEMCEGMGGLIEDALKVPRKGRTSASTDTALISHAQRIEHYEIAGYDTLRAYADRLGRARDQNALQSTLAEELGAADRLTTMMEEVINPKVAVG